MADFNLSVLILGSLPAGSNIMGKVGIDSASNVVSDSTAQAILTSILAKLSSDPATQTTMASILAKLSADPATQTTLAEIKTALGGTLTAALTGVLPGGTVYPAGATKWTVSATSGANAAAAATKGAEANKKHYCLGYLVALRAAAAANDTLVTIKDDATAKFTDVIGSAAPVGTRVGISSATPLIEGTTNKDLSLNAGAAGAGAITELTIWGYSI
jgi:hypothetical protein